VVKKEEGVSTLGAIDVWFDESVKRLNNEERGKFLGSFKSDEKILTVMQSGEYRLTGYDLTTHFDEDLIHIEKFDPQKVMTVIYYEGNQGFWYMKRFQVEESDKKILFISEHPDSKLISFSMDERPVLEVKFDDKKNEKEIESEEVVAEDFIGVKSYKAKGKRLSNFAIKKINWLVPLEPEKKEPEDADDMQADSSEKSKDDQAELPEPEKESADTGKPGAGKSDDMEIKSLDKQSETTKPSPLKPPARKKRKSGEDDNSQMTLF
jgi:topoisomerase-4 subunit A